MLRLGTSEHGCYPNSLYPSLQNLEDVDSPTVEALVLVLVDDELGEAM